MKKSALINVIFNVLIKAFPYVCKNDSVCRDLFFNLPKNLSVNMGVYGEGAYITIEKTENQILKAKPAKETADLEVLFKTRRAAKKVLLGSIGVAESFSRHDILLKGDINTAVRLVRIIDRVEYYLFPRLITKKFLPKMKKEFSSFKVYGYLLFLKSKNCFIEKVNNAKAKPKKIKNAENVQENTKTSEQTDKKLQNED